MTRFSGYSSLLLAAGCSLLLSCSPKPQDELRQAIAQKLMLDFRYYCDNAPVEKAACRQPMTHLPKPLFRLIENSSLGGVILFRENLTTPEQIIGLNYELQRAAMRSSAAIPMFIGIDQEGGRVFRTPRDQTTAFSGSMAIGATAASYGDHFATVSGDIIARELKALGINLNFAPTVDVNVNPLNPVINIRSFGENPQLVSKLASAQLSAMQNQHVLGTLKHFPGHGDTHVDSHTGLPLVTHDIATIQAVDLLPFRQIIEQDAPAMIMTAHIQYPALDNSTLLDMNSQPQIRPATLSRAILTDLLRHEMGFSGLIVTDALDMAGISHFFDPVQAVIETFKAGSDIAVMPLRLHYKTELEQLDQLIDKVVEAVERGELSREEVLASAERIRSLKQQYQLHETLISDKTASLYKAKDLLGSATHRQQEQALAEAAITVVRGQEKLPLAASVQKLQLFMPDRRICLAFQQALAAEHPELNTHCVSMLHYNSEQARILQAQADIVVVGSLNPAPSAVELGGMEDMTEITGQALSHLEVVQHIPAIISSSQQLQKPVYFISLRSPYDIPLLAQQAEVVIATFGNDLYPLPESTEQQPLLAGPSYRAVARLLTGKFESSGVMPVSLNKPSTEQQPLAARAANMETLTP